MAAAYKLKQLHAEACRIFNSVEFWFLQPQVGVATIKEMAQTGAGQPDVLAVYVGIQEG
jgi:hypothetical protein